MTHHSNSKTASKHQPPSREARLLKRQAKDAKRRAVFRALLRGDSDLTCSVLAIPIGHAKRGEMV